MHLTGSRYNLRFLPSIPHYSERGDLDDRLSEQARPPVLEFSRAFVFLSRADAFNRVLFQPHMRHSGAAMTSTGEVHNDLPLKASHCSPGARNYIAEILGGAGI